MQLYYSKVAVPFYMWMFEKNHTVPYITVCFYFAKGFRMVLFIPDWNERFWLVVYVIIEVMNTLKRNRTSQGLLSIIQIKWMFIDVRSLVLKLFSMNHHCDPQSELIILGYYWQFQRDRNAKSAMEWSVIVMVERGIPGTQAMSDNNREFCRVLPATFLSFHPHMNISLHW